MSGSGTGAEQELGVKKYGGAGAERERSGERGYRKRRER